MHALSSTFDSNCAAPATILLVGRQLMRRCLRPPSHLARSGRPWTRAPSSLSSADHTDADPVVPKIGPCRAELPQDPGCLQLHPELRRSHHHNQPDSTLIGPSRGSPLGRPCPLPDDSEHADLDACSATSSPAPLPAGPSYPLTRARGALPPGTAAAEIGCDRFIAEISPKLPSEKRLQHPDHQHGFAIQHGNHPRASYPDRRHAHGPGAPIRARKTAPSPRCRRKLPPPGGIPIRDESLPEK